MFSTHPLGISSNTVRKREKEGTRETTQGIPWFTQLGLTPSITSASWTCHMRHMRSLTLHTNTDGDLALLFL